MANLSRVALILWTVFCLAPALSISALQIWGLAMSLGGVTDAASGATTGGVGLSSVLWLVIWAAVGVPLAVLSMLLRRR